MTCAKLNDPKLDDKLTGSEETSVPFNLWGADRTTMCDPSGRDRQILHRLGLSGIVGILLAATGVLLAACGGATPYPRDTAHEGTTDNQCIECHVDGNDSRAPDGHYRDGQLRDDLRNCTECHEAED